MGSLPRIIFICAMLFLTNPISSQQFYDKTNCYADSQVLGSNYLCTAQNSHCQAYIAYRAEEGFSTLSSISGLFGLNPHDQDLFTLNRMNESESNITLRLGREVLIPINCSCPDRFSRAIIKYKLSPLDSYERVACKVFQGMAKAQSVVEENPEFGGGSDGVIKVPIRCSCPGDAQGRNGVKYIVTYPVMDNDYVDLIGKKFGVSDESIMDANRLNSSFATIYPHTTLLVPTKDVPVLHLNVVASPQYPPRGPGDVIVVSQDGQKSTNLKLNRLLAAGVLAVIIVLAILGCLLCIRFRRRCHPRRFQPLSPRSSQPSDFAQDFLDGMSKLKHSVVTFSISELKAATEDFNATSVIGSGLYRGRIGSSYVAIEEVSSEEAARHVVDILTRINHQNIVKLEGCCCCVGAKSFLVLEFAGNGSLADCLTRGRTGPKLRWKMRTQIALDLAVGLHYVHYCIKPSYVHRNINSKTVLITSDWRAKISGFGLAKPEETEWVDSVVVGKKGYLAPEYYKLGLASPKVDVFAFGVVLIELLSGKDASEDGKLLTESARFLTDIVMEGSTGCLEKLKGFIDPGLDGDFEFNNVVCLAFLAKACLEEDPRNRPTMNDVLKALSSIA